MKKRKGLKCYCIEGIMEHPRDHVREYVHAVSEAQAKKVVALRLEERHKQKVYIGNCTVRAIPKLR